VTISFSTTLDSAENALSESWGISDFVVEYYTDDVCSWDFEGVPTPASLFGKNEYLLRCEFG
jgi:hypothetical protein